LLRFTPADNFFAEVAQVKVTVTDRRATNNTSNEKAATKVITPLKTNGQVCDPSQGFDFCKGTVQAPLVCATTAGNSKCTATATARNSAVSAAQVLSPSTGKTSVTGKITASLWDPATGCTTPQPPQADSIVKLTLASDAAKVTLSTDFPYTSFDTVLYVLTMDSNKISEPVVFDPRVQNSTDFWCIDDQPEVSGQDKNNRAILELKNLTAGTYLVVVDSVPNVDATGDLFQLNVAVE
jgi:hypothetical protein